MRVLAATLLSTAAVILLGLPRPVLGSLSPRQQGPSGGLSRGLDLDLASAPLAGREADEADELDELGELELGRHHQRHGARDDNGGRGAVVRREKRQAAATSATSPATASATATLPAAPGAGDENYVEACPNPEYQGLNETVTCLNFTDPVMPKGYGGRTCSTFLFQSSCALSLFLEWPRSRLAPYDDVSVCYTGSVRVVWFSVLHAFCHLSYDSAGLYALLPILSTAVARMARYTTYCCPLMSCHDSSKMLMIYP